MYGLEKEVLNVRSAVKMILANAMVIENFNIMVPTHVTPYDHFVVVDFEACR